MKGVRVAGVSALVCLAAACALPFGAGSPVVREDELERSVRQSLGEELGQEPGVDCPGDLEGTAGTTMRCTFTAEGKTFDLTVTVTSIENDTVKYDIEVESAP